MYARAHKRVHAYVWGGGACACMNTVGVCTSGLRNGSPGKVACQTLRPGLNGAVPFLLDWDFSVGWRCFSGVCILGGL